LERESNRASESPVQVHQDRTSASSLHCVDLVRAFCRSVAVRMFTHSSSDTGKSEAPYNLTGAGPNNFPNIFTPFRPFPTAMDANVERRGLTKCEGSARRRAWRQLLPKDKRDNEQPWTVEMRRRFAGQIGARASNRQQFRSVWSASGRGRKWRSTGSGSRAKGERSSEKDKARRLS
jgi:hypothetical protein